MMSKLITLFIVIFGCTHAYSDVAIPHPPITIDRAKGKTILLFTQLPCQSESEKYCTGMYSINMKNNKMNFIFSFNDWKVISVFSVNIPGKPVFVLSTKTSDVKNLKGKYYRALQFEVIEGNDGVYVDFFPKEPQYDKFNYCFDGIDENNNIVSCSFKDSSSIRKELINIYRGN